MNELLALGLILVLLQACPCSVPGGEQAQITGMTARDGTITENGGTTTQRVQAVSGTVTDPDPSTTDVFDGRVVIDRNGDKQYVTPVWDGEKWTFSGDMVLTRGTNAVKVSVEDENGNEIGASSPFSVNANIPARDITVTLTWNTDSTDVDMHVFDPEGNHAWYNSLTGISGGSLDLDDTDGYGPETFTMETATPGEWVVKVRYFDDHGVSAPSTATVKLTLNEQNTQTFTHTFTADQANRDDTSNDWEVIRFNMP